KAPSVAHSVECPSHRANLRVSLHSRYNSTRCWIHIPHLLFKSAGGRFRPRVSNPDRGRYGNDLTRGPTCRREPLQDLPRRCRGGWGNLLPVDNDEGFRPAGPDGGGKDTDAGNIDDAGVAQRGGSDGGGVDK